MDQATRFECVLDARADLGEGPVWSGHDRALWWVDIHAGRLHRLRPDDGRLDTIELGEPIGSFAPRVAGGFVAALKSGFWLLDKAGGRQRLLAHPLAPYPHQRLNDGRCDRAGRFFWAGAIDETLARADGALHRIDPDGRCEAAVQGLTVSNGLAWSPDGRTMYHSDTPTRIVRAYDYDAERGTLSNGRVFHRFEGRGRYPDGAAVDAAGRYWVALYGAATVACLSPQGELLAEYPLPARCPTMPAFGGDDLRTLYVTSARRERPAEELQRYPLSGGLFAMRVDEPGLPEPPFAG